MSAAGDVGETVKINKMSTSEKRRTISELLKSSNNGKFCRGCLKQVGEIFQQHPETIRRLWKNYTNLKTGGAVAPSLYNERKGIDPDSLRVAFKEIPIQSCVISRGVAAELGSAKTTLLRSLKNIGLRACSRHLKTFLSPPARKKI